MLGRWMTWRAGRGYPGAYLGTRRPITTPFGYALHLILSSLDEVDIREELGASPEQTIKMKNDSIGGDIASFISQHLRDNRRLLKWDEYHARLETTLTTRAQGG